MSLDFSRTRLQLFKHQKEDVEWLIDQPFAFISSEMRTGKSAIVITAVQFMFEAGLVNRAIVIAPSPVRGVWFDPEMGEIAKHSWEGAPANVSQFHDKVKSWIWGDPRGKARLDWWVTNYEFVRSKARLQQLLGLCGPKTILILDESSFIKNYKSQQAKACMTLRKQCGRVVLLNGTPISHSPMDLFSQGNILHPKILDCSHITHYKARYALMKPVLSKGGKVLLDPFGRKIETVAGWQHLDDLQRRFAPYTVRRLQKDCLDLPPKLDPVILSATLTPETWRMYKAMRDEMVVWLKSGVATARQAAVKVMRLRQITSGILGGLEDEPVQQQLNVGLGVNGEVLDFEPAEERPPLAVTTIEIGREKLDVLLWFIGQRLEADPNFRVVVWSVFRLELERITKAVAEAYPQFAMGVMMGGQSSDDRTAAMKLLHPDTTPGGPVFVGGIYGTGSFGLNFTAAHTSINCSFDYSLGRNLQAKDRVYGPGQTQPVAYFDIVATGPAGQKTIDHVIVAARLRNENIADFTTAGWVKLLTDE